MLNLGRSTRTCNKEGITRKDSPLVPILHEVADTILGVARGMECRHRDALSNLELFSMLRSLTDSLAVSASNDFKISEFIELDPMVRLKHCFVKEICTISSLPPA